MHNGLLYDIKGRPFDTSGGTSHWGSGDGRAIFVMDEHGNLYASNDHRVGRFHHSSFLAGGPVAGAGELRVVNERLSFMSDQSGHYRPRPEYLQQVVERLRAAGVDLDEVDFGSWVAEMASEWWRAVTTTLLYSAQFERLNDDLVDRRARALLEEPVVDLTPEQEYRAISEALASGASLTEPIPGQHGEQEFREFLQRLLARMDAMRPWQEPPNRPLSDSRWAEYGDARVVGRIGMAYVDAQGRIKYVFRSVQEGDRKIQVMVLQLRSGDEVALAAPWWPQSQDVAVLTRDHKRRAEDIVVTLVDGTEFTAEEVTAVPEDNAAPLGTRH